MSYMNQAAFAPAGGIQELNFDEIDQVDGGARAAALVIRVIDWLGRVQTVAVVLDALPEVDLTEIGEHEQARRPGANG
jgi:hypothetical protein